MNPPHFSNDMRLQTLFLFRRLRQDGRASFSGISDPFESYLISLVTLGWQVSLTLDELLYTRRNFCNKYLFHRLMKENQNKHRL
jgi:hypothetical protein